MGHHVNNTVNVRLKVGVKIFFEKDRLSYEFSLLWLERLAKVVDKKYK